MNNPYEVMPSAQQDPASTPPPLPPFAQTLFRSGKGLATATVVLLAIESLLNVLMSGTALSAAGKLESGGLTSDAAPALLAFSSISVLSSVVTLALAIVYLMWLYRAYSNLRALNGDFIGKFTPGWVVGWWFIPFANLVMPYQAVRELYVHSAPAQTGPGGFAIMPNAGIVGAWWAAFILRGVVAWGVVGNGRSLSGLESMLYWTTVSGLVSAAAGVLCLIIVRRIDGNQETAARAITA